MISLYVSEPSFFGELANVIRLFSSERSVAQAVAHSTAGARLALEVFPRPAGGTEPCTARLYEDGMFRTEVTDETRFLKLREGAAEEKRQRLHQAKRAVYRLLSVYFNKMSRWGALTGVRPTKLLRELAERHGEDSAVGEFTDAYLVASDRAAVARQIVHTQKSLLSLGGVFIYCGIPFILQPLVYRLRPGAQIHHCPQLFQQRTINRSHRGASPHGIDALSLVLCQLFQHFCLHLPESLLALTGKNLTDGFSGFALYQLVRILQSILQPIRQPDT